MPATAPAKLLISACLLGNPVRYDGRAKALHHTGLQCLQAEGRVVCFCPEVSAGLPVPRPAAEIVGGDGAAVIDGNARVLTGHGSDVSAYFIAGAERALALCRQHSIRAAVMTDGSPSCGSSRIYDGSFSRRSIDASGVTSALLRRHGIAVFSQLQLAAAIDFVNADC